jgi:hypothetical protein
MACSVKYETQRYDVEWCTVEGQFSIRVCFSPLGPTPVGEKIFVPDLPPLQIQTFFVLPRSRVYFLPFLSSVLGSISCLIFPSLPSGLSAQLETRWSSRPPCQDVVFSCIGCREKSFTGTRALSPPSVPMKPVVRLNLAGCTNEASCQMKIWPVVPVELVVQCIVSCPQSKS